MKIHIAGTPDEVGHVIEIFTKFGMLIVTEVGGPYTIRGNSRKVRVYLDAQFSEWVARSWLAVDPHDESSVRQVCDRLRRVQNKPVP